MVLDGFGAGKMSGFASLQTSAVLEAQLVEHGLKSKHFVLNHMGCIKKRYWVEI